MIKCRVCSRDKKIPRCDSHPKTLDTCYVCHLKTPVSEGGHTVIDSSPSEVPRP